jgi:hypothetical protein
MSEDKAEEAKAAPQTGDDAPKPRRPPRDKTCYNCGKVSSVIFVTFQQPVASTNSFPSTGWSYCKGLPE